MHITINMTNIDAYFINTKTLYNIYNVLISQQTHVYLSTISLTPIQCPNNSRSMYHA